MPYLSFAWMRRVDSWIGRPIARALSVFATKPKCLNGSGPESLPKRVICSKFVGLGSIVLAFPLLKALKDQGVRIAFWSFEGQADLVRLSGLADEIFILRPTLGGVLPSFLKSWIQARRFKADAFLDLETTANFSAVLAKISGAKIRMGFLSAPSAREKLFTHLVALTPERHMIENNLKMARRLGIEARADSPLPALPSLEKIRNVIPEFGGRRRIVVNINSSDSRWQRMWPEENWVALCNQLLEDHRVDLIFLGTAHERDRVQNLVYKLKDPTRVFNIAGETLLVELLKLLSCADLAISVESGAMHMAAWVGTPLVALFGPETPRLSSPSGARAQVLRAELPCSPCMSTAQKSTRCGDNQCMKRITPEQVLAACRKFLNGRDSSKAA